MSAAANPNRPHSLTAFTQTSQFDEIGLSSVGIYFRNQTIKQVLYPAHLDTNNIALVFNLNEGQFESLNWAGFKA